MSNYLVIDIGGTAIKYAIMDEEANIISQAETPTLKSSLDDFLNVLDSVVLPVKEKVAGIAMSMPGRIDNKTGFMYTSGAIAFIQNMPFGNILKERYQLPVTIENDGKCAALAEAWKGNLSDVASGVVAVLGTGIGGGIVLNHQVWRGFTGSAGELSAVPSNFEYPKEYQYFWAVANGYPGLTVPYAKMKGINPEEMNGKLFFKDLHDGDPQAKEVFDHFIKTLLSGILNVQAILDVEKIVIGGGISAQDILIESIQNEVHQYFTQGLGVYSPVQEPKIDRCKFRNDANLIGALKNFFNQQA